MDNKDHNIGYEQMVREEWTAPSTVDAWRRWSDKLAVHTRALTQGILDFAKLKSGQNVLDLASGSGEPALSIAKHISPDGQVTATDLSSDMLRIAEDNAKRMKVSNISFHRLMLINCHLMTNLSTA
jgi:methylase of polypeptide subunit release factors